MIRPFHPSRCTEKEKRKLVAASFVESAAQACAEKLSLQPCMWRFVGETNSENEQSLCSFYIIICKQKNLNVTVSCLYARVFRLHLRRSLIKLNDFHSLHYIPKSLCQSPKTPSILRSSIQSIHSFPSSSYYPKYTPSYPSEPDLYQPYSYPLHFSMHRQSTPPTLLFPWPFPLR